MQNFMIISLIAFVNAYPEAGYNYNHPGNIINGQQQHHHQHHHNSIGQSNGQLIGSTGSGGYSTSNNGLNINNYNNAGNGLINNIGIGHTNGIDTTFGNNNNIGGSTIGSTLVQKHIYVHIPPPDLTDNIQIQRQISSVQAQKHYKIIFIKAPTVSSYSQQQIALAGQNQEKTIVYVLVKKTDDINDLNIQQIPPTPPSKPEVYFIKYKAQKESNLGGLSGNSVNGNEIKTTTGQSISGSGSIGNSGISSSEHTIIGGTGIGGVIGGGSFTSSGIGSSSIGGGGPIPQYGPPGKSGPY